MLAKLVALIESVEQFKLVEQAELLELTNWSKASRIGQTCRIGRTNRIGQTNRIGRTHRNNDLLLKLLYVNIVSASLAVIVKLPFRCLSLEFLYLLIV